MEEELEWCLWDGAKDTDYFLDEWDIDNLPELFDKDDIIFEYNQGNSKDCTIYWAIGAVSDLTNYPYPQERIDKNIKESYNRWRVKWQWWFVESACKLIKDDWNNDPELVKKYGKIAYYRVRKVNDEIIEKILSKKYTLVGNRSTASEFTADYRTDWKLDGKDFGTNTNWHCIDIISYKWVRSEKNSYKWRKTYDGKKDCNIFELVHHLFEISNYWPNLYVFTLVKEDNYAEIKRLNEIKSLCNDIIEKLWKLRHLVNDTNFQWILHYTADKLRGKIWDVDNELKKF